MENVSPNTAYQKFASLLVNEKIYIDGTVTFRKICKWLDIAPEALDALLYDELGTSGDDVLKILRRQYAENLIFVIQNSTLSGYTE